MRSAKSSASDKAYRIEFTEAARRDLVALPRTAQRRIDAAIRMLSTNPRPPKAKKLKGQWRDYWRIRTGDYRILYQIEDDRLVICVIRIRDRKDVYR